MSAHTEDMTHEELVEKKFKKRKILLISGFGLAGLQLIASIVMMVILGLIKVVPKDYVVMIDIILVLLVILVVITQRWLVSGIISKIFSLLLTIALIAGCIYLNITYGALSRVTGVKEKETVIKVIVLKDNPAESVKDLENETFGIVKEISREYTDKAIVSIQNDIRTTLKLAEYEDVVSLVNALYAGDINVIIMDTSMQGLVENEHPNFANEIKAITKHVEKETIADNDNNKTNKDVVTLYVSGVDVDGPPTEKRNSDVNILIRLNTKTGQILLLNTPRDYYVPTSVSNGMEDKLTHAGCYGVDCSVATLEMFYGIDIDYYIKLNFTGFVSIIDQLGGVDVYSDFDFVSTHGNDHFVIGMNHMTGIQALGFARERYSFPTGDNQRGKNQMKVINSLITKLTSSEMLKNYTGVITSISDCMVTDMTLDDIGELVDAQLKNNITWDIKQFAVVGTGNNLPSFSLPSPNYVMIPNPDSVALAKELLGKIENNEKITDEDLVFPKPVVEG